jgi:dimethylargininase
MPLVALTREISPRIADCQLTHLARTPIDVTRAREQHAAYEDALRTLGCDVRRVPPAPECPDSVFIEDTAVILDGAAVICRPGAESRAMEVEPVAEALGQLMPVHRVHPSAALDGGDVIVAGRRIFVGVGYRTNGAAAAELQRIAAPLGYQVIPVSFAGCLHLKSAATLAADDLVLLNPDWVDAQAFAPWRSLRVDPSEPFGANVVRIGNAVVHGAAYPRTAERLRAAGLRVLPVPADELAKAEGAVTCCSLLVNT